MRASVRSADARVCGCHACSRADGQLLADNQATNLPGRSSAEAALDKANERIILLETKIKEISSEYAKEIMNLKNKLVQSHTSAILNTSDSHIGNDSDILAKTSPMRSAMSDDGEN